MPNPPAKKNYKIDSKGRLCNHLRYFKYHNKVQKMKFSNKLIFLIFLTIHLLPIIKASDKHKNIPELS